MTLEVTPCHCTACPPAEASPAPMTPPIRACEELEGSPRYQVARFHRMPPASPANTIVSVTRWV